MIFAFTLLPKEGPDEVELVPLSDVAHATWEANGAYFLHAVLEVAGNVLLFMPLGAALNGRGVGVRNAAVTGLLLSTAIELVQLVAVPGRTASLDDVVLNMLGTVLGHGVFSRWKERRGLSPATHE